MLLRRICSLGFATLTVLLQGSCSSDDDAGGGAVGASSGWTTLAVSREVLPGEPLAVRFGLPAMSDATEASPVDLSVEYAEDGTTFSPYTASFTLVDLGRDAGTLPGEVPPDASMQWYEAILKRSPATEVPVAFQLRFTATSGGHRYVSEPIPITAKDAPAWSDPPPLTFLGDGPSAAYLLPLSTGGVVLMGEFSASETTMEGFVRPVRRVMPGFVSVIDAAGREKWRAQIAHRVRSGAMSTQGLLGLATHSDRTPGAFLWSWAVFTPLGALAWATPDANTDWQETGTGTRSAFTLNVRVPIDDSCRPENTSLGDIVPDARGGWSVATHCKYTCYESPCGSPCYAANVSSTGFSMSADDAFRVKESSCDEAPLITSDGDGNLYLSIIPEFGVVGPAWLTSIGVDGAKRWSVSLDEDCTDLYFLGGVVGCIQGRVGTVRYFNAETGVEIASFVDPAGYWGWDVTFLRSGSKRGDHVLRTANGDILSGDLKRIGHVDAAADVAAADEAGSSVFVVTMTSSAIPEASPQIGPKTSRKTACSRMMSVKAMIRS